MKIINTRQDLDSIQGTPEYDNFINYLKGSINQRRDIQVYPENYLKPDYTGEKLEPIWETFEDTSVIEKFEFTKEELK
jgi:uncharacterized NAD(P)/FAD-binding protein YdhS